MEAEDRIYNAILVNYFISKYNYDKCTIPMKMLDVNVASDYRAIMKLFNIGDSEENFKVLNDLILNGKITASLQDRFELGQNFTREDFITLLYAMGFITIKKELFGEEIIFKIPNYVIKILYFNYYNAPHFSYH